MSDNRAGELPLHCFADASLARRALTHCSFAAQNNERLEWLGDSLLGFIISRHLYRRHPSLSEGVLSQARARLVSGESLAQVARTVALSAHLRLGKSAARLREHPAILADALESYLAAIFLDSDYQTAEKIILKLFAAPLLRAEKMLQDDSDSMKDGKTRLQELLHARKKNTPVYTAEPMSGPDHDPRWTVHCEIDGEIIATATAANPRAAEQKASLAAFKKLAAADPKK